MYKLFLSCLLLALLQPCRVAAADGTVYLESWLVGIIAVAGFLVVAFVFLLFNHYVCEKFYEYDQEEAQQLAETNGHSNNVYVNHTFTSETPSNAAEAEKVDKVEEIEDVYTKPQEMSTEL